MNLTDKANQVAGELLIKYIRPITFCLYALYITLAYSKKLICKNVKEIGLC